MLRLGRTCFDGIIPFASIMLPESLVFSFQKFLIRTVGSKGVQLYDQKINVRTLADRVFQSRLKGY